MKRIARFLGLLTLFAATPAFAHVGLGDHGGFMHGFMHPIGGADHVLAMVGVGLLAAQLGGRAIWLVPTTFVSMMVLGGVLGFEGVDIPFVEAGIAASVIVLGALVAFGAKLPTALAMAIVGAFAIFHGHAHGWSSGRKHTAGVRRGFRACNSLLHAAGIGLGFSFTKLPADRAPGPRKVGGVMAAIGVSLLS